MISPPAHRFASHWIEDSVRRSARMRVYAVSRKVGRPQGDLQNLCEVFDGGFTMDGSAGLGLVFYAPTIKDAAPRLLDQPSLFGDNLDPEDTVFDLLNDAISDVRTEYKDSSRFDKDLLGDFTRLIGSHERGIDQLQIGSLRYAQPAVADSVLGQRAESLLAVTPPPRRVRMTAELDMVRVSDAVFELIVADPEDRVRAVWIGDDPQELGHLLRKSVLVEGDLVYRPNGRPLRLEAERIRPATHFDQAFAAAPRPAVEVRTTKPANAISYKQLIGSWPGDETDEELRKLLEAIS